MRRLLAALAVLALASHAPAQQKTTNLGLLLTQHADENQNWNLLDQVICPGAVPGTPCKNGASAIGGGGQGLNVVTQFGADPSGALDATAAIQAALNQQTSTCQPVYLPAGVYTISYPGLTYQSCGGLGPGNRAARVFGDGDGATYVRTDTTGTGFAVFHSRQQTTCQGGSGAATTCGDPFFFGTRGPGCPCDNQPDCQSGVCGGGASDRGATFDHFAIQLRKNFTGGFDLTGLASTTIQNVDIFPSTALSVAYGVTGVGTVLASYYNVLIGNHISGLPVCVLLGDNANAWSLFGNFIGNGCGSGIVLTGEATVGFSLSGAKGNHLVGNTFQSLATPVCGGACVANTCCGGYFNGSTCATSADCHEGDVVDLGDQNAIVANYFEDAVTKIWLGCGAQAGGLCTVNDASSNPMVAFNSYFGVAAGRIAHGTAIAAGKPAYVLDINNNGALTPDAFYTGGPWGTTTSIACSTANPGQPFYDTNCHRMCFCNGQATPRYCRYDTGACGSSTTDCC